MRILIVGLCAALVAVLPAAGAQTPPPPPFTEEALAEEEIVVEAPGPPLWRVYDTDSEVLILGAISVLPRNARWSNRALEAALARADRLYVAEDFGVGIAGAARLLLAQRDAFQNPDGARLREILPAGLYARTAAAAAAMEVDMDDIERLRPYAAGSRLLQQVIPAQRLETVDLTDNARRLARRARVRVTELEAPSAGPLLRALNAMPTGADVACLETQLDSLERQGPLVRARALAWARGDVAELRRFAAMVDPAACLAELGDAGVDLAGVVHARERQWRDTIIEALRRPGVRVAVMEVGMLLSPTGVLADLRAAGFSVDEGA